MPILKFVISFDYVYYVFGSKNFKVRLSFCKTKPSTYIIEYWFCQTQIYYYILAFTYNGFIITNYLLFWNLVF